MTKNESAPLKNLDMWEEDLLKRYPDRDSIAEGKSREEYRNYDNPERDTVREFYRLNHTFQTYDFVMKKRDEFLKFNKKEMPVWDAFQFLNQLVDDSDPDTDLDQFHHLLQTSEAIRRDGHPDWFVMVGLLRDMGKVLCLFGEPQWAVVGDTFPVGCAFSDKVVYPEFFAGNRDSQDSLYRTRNGIYSPGCGLDNVHFSWGHDEYLYHVVKDYLPEEASCMIRYHSCYVIHQQREYEHLMSERDQKMFDWVRNFSRYDLYSKSPERPDVATLKLFYQDLIAEFFPPKLHW